MIEFIEHSKIDKDKWDDRISHSFHRNIYCNSWYLDMVCPGWNALVEGDYHTIMPLTWNKKYGISYLYQPYFTQQLGIYGDKDISIEKTNELLNAIPEQYRFIEINLNINNHIDDNRYETKKLPTYLLDLNQDYKKLHAGYSDNLKRNLVKASKHGLSTKNDSGIEEIIRLFRDNRGKEVSNLKDIHYNLLRKLINTVGEKGVLNKIGVYNMEGALLAGAFFLNHNHQAVFLFSGLSEQGKQNGAMAYLIDSFIKSHAGQDLVLDFEGSVNPNLARFYKSFGSSQQEYPNIQRNLLPRPIKWLKR
ncbi:MAG: hypothetical protein WCL14_00320 [Bacteroidota bacterium]